MEKKRALMVVAGGRGVPDALALLYLKPALVLPVTSIEGWETKTAFFHLADRIGCEVLPMEQIDAYNLTAAIAALKNFREQCNRLHSTREWDWIITITSAPKILAFAAYEVAKELEIPCWYIASQQEKVVSLVKEYEQVDTNRFFHLSFNDYIKIQGRTCQERKPFPDYRHTVQNWGDVAEKLARSEETSQLLPIFYRHRKRPGKSIDNAFRDPMFLPPEIEALQLVKWLVGRGMLKVSRTRPEGTPYRFASKIAAQFMTTGDWLEVYVWDQINKTKGEGNGKPFADDCRWGCKIPKDEVEYELDVAVMYKAQLVIAECKTDEQPFRGENNYLRILDAVADQLGGDYVSKVFITNCRKGGASYEAFNAQARQLNIEVVTWESLPAIGEIIKQLAMHPKYPRK